MATWLSHRTIIEEHEVAEAVDRFVKKYNRFDEAFEALKWLLARNGDEVAAWTKNNGGTDYHLYRQAGDPLAKTPDIIVLFTCDDDQIVLISINAEETEPEED